MSDLINTLRVLRAIYKEVYQLTRKSVFISVCVTDVLYGQTIRCICNISPVLCELSLKFVVDFVKVNNKSYHHWNRNKTTLAKVDRNCRFALNCNHQSSPCSFSAHHWVGGLKLSVPQTITTCQQRICFSLTYFTDVCCTPN